MICRSEQQVLLWHIEDIALDIISLFILSDHTRTSVGLQTYLTPARTHFAIATSTHNRPKPHTNTHRRQMSRSSRQKHDEAVASCASILLHKHSAAQTEAQHTHLHAHASRTLIAHARWHHTFATRLQYANRSTARSNLKPTSLALAAVEY